MPKIVIIDEVLRKVRYYKNKMVQFLFASHGLYALCDQYFHAATVRVAQRYVLLT